MRMLCNSLPPGSTHDVLLLPGWVKAPKQITDGHNTGSIPSGTPNSFNHLRGKGQLFAIQRKYNVILWAEGPVQYLPGQQRPEVYSGLMKKTIEDVRGSFNMNED